jgi:hypothetical protein
MPEDLDAVFGAEEGAEPDTMLDPAVDDGAGDEEALDMAIDEAFDATDPDVRREAFKNAVRLCKAY